MKFLAEENALLRDEVRSLRDQLFNRQQELNMERRPSPANPISNVIEQVQELSLAAESVPKKVEEGRWSQSLLLMDLSFTMGQSVTLAELFRGKPIRSENWNINGAWGELVW